VKPWKAGQPLFYILLLSVHTTVYWHGVQPEIILIGVERSVSYFKGAEDSKLGCCVRLSFPLLPPPPRKAWYSGYGRTVVQDLLTATRKHQIFSKVCITSSLQENYGTNIFIQWMGHIIVIRSQLQLAKNSIIFNFFVFTLIETALNGQTKIFFQRVFKADPCSWSLLPWICTIHPLYKHKFANIIIYHFQLNFFAHIDNRFPFISKQQ